MSNQSGFDYDLLVSRLHGGLCAFQSLRAHRRERAQAAAPAPAAEERVTAPPRAAHVVDEAADLRAVAVEPQAFVTLRGRMVPVFDLGADLPGSMAQAPATDMPMSPAPGATSAPEESRPPTASAPPPTAGAPAPLASTLKLPAPTPPPRLGLVHGGHGRVPAPEAAQPAQSDASTHAPASPSEPHSGEPASSIPAQEGPSAATLTAWLDVRAEQEALRLEKVHADHRAILATLLQEHREELRGRSDAEALREAQRAEEMRTRSDAEAARMAQLLREVLREHRAELDRAAQTHAEQLVQTLSQHERTAQHEAAAEADLKGALIEQASLQREANADVAENIDALTAIVADLGQTVGLLAVAAAQADKQGRLPTRTIFAPPPRVDPAIVAPAPCAVVMPRVEPTAAANSSAPEPAASTAVPASGARVGPAASTSPRPTPCLADTIAVEPAQRQPIPMTLAEEAAARTRVSQAVDEDRDDDDLETVDDDPEPHRPLGPFTALNHHTHEEPRDD